MKLTDASIADYFDRFRELFTKGRNFGLNPEERHEMQAAWEKIKEFEQSLAEQDTEECDLCKQYAAENDQLRAALATEVERRILVEKSRNSYREHNELLRADAEAHQRLVDYVDKTLGWLHPGFHSSEELVDAAADAAKERDALRAELADEGCSNSYKYANADGKCPIRKDPKCPPACRLKFFRSALAQLNTENITLRSDLKEAVECLRPFAFSPAGLADDTVCSDLFDASGAQRSITAARFRQAASLLARLEEKVLRLGADDVIDVCSDEYSYVTKWKERWYSVGEDMHGHRVRDYTQLKFRRRVRRFEATAAGDGVTDDTAAVQAQQHQMNHHTSFSAV